MHRLFPVHQTRRHFYLDGRWQFHIDPQDLGRREGWAERFPADAGHAFVPSCWNNELDLYHYEGAAWYRTTFRSAGRSLRLVFHAVNTEADVYLDGHHLGHHYGGFIPFAFTVAGAGPGEHALTVRVDNTHNATDTIPLSRVDWFHYGGIIRSVEAMELSDLWLADCRIDYALAGSGVANLVVRATVGNLAAQPIASDLRVEVEGRPVYQDRLSFAPGETVQSAQIRLDGIQRWSPEEPRLYTIRLALEGDDLAERIGFREIRAEKGRIFLNGQPLFLKGVNRHEDHADWGFAFPAKLMQKDLDIIKRLGCNAIRCSHYPNSELFLDLCDEEGLLLWEEIPMWGFPEEVLGNPLVLERGLAFHRAMVERDRHHPSIIFWGLHNEIDTTCEAGYRVTEAFAEAVRALDGSRLITYASDHDLDDRCFALADVVSINRYFGWYQDSYQHWPVHLAELKEKLRREGLADRPLLVSEFGAAGIKGDTGFESRKWSEQYQEELLSYLVDLFARDADLSGFYIWQFCDIRSAREMEGNRARSFNNKGLVDEYRRPKLAYWAIERLINGIKR